MKRKLVFFYAKNIIVRSMPRRYLRSSFAVLQEKEMHIDYNYYVNKIKGYSNVLKRELIDVKALRMPLLRNC